MASSPSSSATASNAQPAPTASSSELIASTSSAPAPPQHIKPVVPEGMSKNAHKRLLKQQAFDAAKPARRAKERALRKEKTAEKRKLIELGLLEKPVTKQAAFAELGGRRPFGARVVIDCSFDELMTEKEVKSMSAQLAFCYSSNRASARPFDLMISGLSGRMKEKMEKTSGRPHESWKGVEWWEEGYEGLWKTESTTSSDPAPALSTSTPISTATTNGEASAAASTTSPVESTPPSAQTRLITLGALSGRPRSAVPKSSIIYLTGDSPNVLHTLTPGTTYILGGIVDHNRYKRLCLDKAEKDGAGHAQLPIGSFMGEMKTRKVLTVNQVYDILLHYAVSSSWKEALEAVMPSRKFETDGRKGRRGGAGPNTGAGTAKEGEGEGEGEGGEASSDEGAEVGVEAVYVVQEGEAIGGSAEGGATEKEQKGQPPV